jgi:Ohr subfamily peroxiredoxin
MTSKTLYTARVYTAGSRDGGISRSDDGRIDIAHSIPGTAGKGTNSEQLLAAGWSACFQGAMGLAAGKMRVKMPPTAVDAEVDLRLGEDGYSLQARLKVTVPGVDREIAQRIVDEAHATCPYSKALRGIPVEVTLA